MNEKRQTNAQFKSLKRLITNAHKMIEEDNANQNNQTLDLLTEAVDQFYKSNIGQPKTGSFVLNLPGELTNQLKDKLNSVTMLLNNEFYFYDFRGEIRNDYFLVSWRRRKV